MYISISFVIIGAGDHAVIVPLEFMIFVKRIAI